MNDNGKEFECDLNFTTFFYPTSRRAELIPFSRNRAIDVAVGTIRELE